MSQSPKANEGQIQDLTSSASLYSASASQLLPPGTCDRTHIPGDTLPSAHGVFLVIHKALVYVLIHPLCSRSREHVPCM